VRVRPDDLHERVLLDDPASLPDQHEQRVEGLGRQGHRVSIPAQLARGDIQPEGSEREDGGLLVDSRH
jgi:hypothetical protein